LDMTGGGLCCSLSRLAQAPPRPVTLPRRADLGGERGLQAPGEVTGARSLPPSRSVAPPGFVGRVAG
jgi:hypothetical protein